jgi:hypothetical protein
VTTGDLDLLAGLDLIAETRREQWREWINAATNVDPRTFARNGFTVYALQAAWAAITWTAVPDHDPTAGRYPAQHFQLALENAVRAGDDTDTVAAIAGGLLGAFWGQSAIPHQWTRAVHGYGACRAHDLVALAALTVVSGRSDERGWPRTSRVDYGSLSPRVKVSHPHDPGVILGSYASISEHGCDAVVSLCRIGPDDRADAGNLGEDHVEVRLLDSEYSNDNPHLHFVIADAARAVQTLRRQGKTVFLHCARAEQRTPAIAFAYALLLGVEPAQARADVLTALPSASGRGYLWDAATS